MDVKELARKLCEDALAAHVRFPKIWDESQKVQECGKILMISKNDMGEYDSNQALATIIEKHGQDQIEPKKSPKRKRKADDSAIDGSNEHNDEEANTKTQKKAATVLCDRNRDLASSILEIGAFYFKNGDSRKGGVFSKAAKAIRECETEITTGKEALKLKGIGKGIAAYIEEYLTTGSIVKLEELKAGIA